MRWVARAMLRVCAAVEAPVPLCITAAPVSSSAQTPAWCPSNAPRCRSTAVQPQIFHISDEYAKQYAVKHLGPDVVAHMQVRVGENTQLTSSSSTGTQAFTS